MQIDVFSAFPEYLEGPLGAALLGKARAEGVVDVRIHDLRSWATDRHRSIDDSPLGGGPGMVLMPEPVFRAVEETTPPRPLLLLSPAGRRFDQLRARELAAGRGFSLVCGRYEGVDERVAEQLCDDEISVGDFVLAGGEAAALIVIEAVTRLVPGVIGNESSVVDESFNAARLEYPQYTRPAEFRGWSAPAVLLSGDHGRISRWRRAQALRRTIERRPDLLGRDLTSEERALLDEFPSEHDDR